MKEFLARHGISPVMLGGVVAVIVLAVAAFFVGRATKPEAVVQATATPTASATATASPSPEFSPTPTATPVAAAGKLVSDTGVTWLGTAQKLADLKLFKYGGDYCDSEDTGTSTYYKVGTDKGRDIIYASSGDGMGSMFYVLRAEGKNTYSYLHLVTDGNLNNPADTSKTCLTSAVTSVDTTTRYASVVPSERLEVAGSILSTYSSGTVSSSVFNPASKDVKFADTIYGSLYKVRGDVSDDYSVGENIMLRTQDGMGWTYSPEVGFDNDDLVPSITWTNGSKVTDPYHVLYIHKGCSTGYTRVLKDGSLSSWTVTGTASDGTKIYEPAKDSAVLKAEYQTFGGTLYEYANGTSSERKVSYDEYVTKHPLVAFTNAYGQVVLYGNTTYGLQAECGKPVVYLYPTKEQQVTVKVAADVTVSEPAYGKGWTVIAKPNGELKNVDGKTYDSLFWEGLGHGTYPDVKSGFVVAQADLEKTMRSHLAQLGLNAKESADFMEFWMPRMPKTAYVRLTWFGTKEMDALAPLSVTPKPDTSIRIFLDFQGLDTKVGMPEQKLTAIPRKGFTLVEWGGLLIH